MKQVTDPAVSNHKMVVRIQRAYAGICRLCKAKIKPDRKLGKLTEDGWPVCHICCGAPKRVRSCE